MQDRFVGPFKIEARVGPTAYKLKLKGTGLQGIHDVFHVSLLRPYANNGLYQPVPPIELDDGPEYEVDGIKNHRTCRGEP